MTDGQSEACRDQIETSTGYGSAKELENLRKNNSELQAKLDAANTVVAGLIEQMKILYTMLLQ